MRRVSGLLLVIVFGGFCCGCGGGSDAPKMAAVEGSVTWNGKPLADAGVAFTPASGPVAIGQTDESGHYSLTTQGRPGAAVGNHQVTIQAFEPLTPVTGGGGVENPAKLIPRIPVKFGELGNSGLDANVKSNAGENKIDFDLK